MCQNVHLAFFKINLVMTCHVRKFKLVVKELIIITFHKGHHDSEHVLLKLNSFFPKTRTVFTGIGPRLACEQNEAGSTNGRIAFSIYSSRNMLNQ